jgi:GNAT superfamily N-acetyltransferase
VTPVEPHIRLATPEDAGAVSALISHFSEIYLLSPTAEEAAAFFATISEPAIRTLIGRADMTYLVAASEGQPLAGAAALRSDGLLFHLFVHSSCQGHGLGRRLWECLRDRAYRSGHHGSFTVHASLNAVPVYEHFGFKVSGASLMRLGGVSVPMRLDPPSAG